jgi:hypothetical protein
MNVLVRRLPAKRLAAPGQKLELARIHDQSYIIWQDLTSAEKDNSAYQKEEVLVAILTESRITAGSLQGTSATRPRPFPRIKRELAAASWALAQGRLFPDVAAGGNN